MENILPKDINLKGTKSKDWQFEFHMALFEKTSERLWEHYMSEESSMPTTPEDAPFFEKFENFATSGLGMPVGFAAQFFVDTAILKNPLKWEDLYHQDFFNVFARNSDNRFKFNDGFKFFIYMTYTEFADEDLLEEIVSSERRVIGYKVTEKFLSIVSKFSINSPPPNKA